MSTCAAALACANNFAQEVQKDTMALQQLDEVVVSDSRFPLQREKSGKTVIKIDAAEIERNQGKSIATLLNTKGGFEIASSRGRNGAVLGVFARGGRGRQVLIVIDGVRVADPSSFSSEYDLRLLSLANIESIEIIKGAASTLYGPNAATAVINITTKKVADKKIALNVASSIGTNQTAANQNYTLSDFTNAVHISGTLDKLTYAVGFANTYADGLSALVTETDEKDPFSKISTDIKLGYNFSTAFDLNFYFNQTKVKNAFDESFGLIDAPYQFLSKQERVGMYANYNYEKGAVHLKTAFSDYNSESISAFPNTFSAENIVLDIYNTHNFNDKFYTVFGLNYIEDKADLEMQEKFSITDPYANLVYLTDFGLHLNLGTRLNMHSEYGSNFVYNVNPSFVIPSGEGYFKLLSSYATSYITPNLTQLFGAFGANSDLEPENDRTIEGGLEYSKDQKLRVSALYFNRKEENFITFDPVTFGSINAANTIDAQGVEIEFDWRASKELQLNMNYTFTERKGDNAIRLPKHKLNANIAYTFSPRLYGSVSYTLTGKRFDSDFGVFPAEEVALEPFSLIDLYLGYTMIPNKLKVFFSANNLLNEEFTEILGFTTRGRNIRLGFNLNL